MRMDLTGEQTPASQGAGTVTGADRLTYTRRTTRVARRDADELVSSGCPVIFDLYGHGRFEWCDGVDAGTEWADERAYVITSDPTPKQLSKHAMWNAGVWESDSGERLVYLTGRC